MDFISGLPERRSVRLKQFDYAQPGAWFVTICTQEKKSIFGKVVDGQVQLNRIGRIVEEKWLQVPHHFPSVELGAHIVMPNHFHALFAVHAKPQARFSHALKTRYDVPLHGNDPLSETYQRPLAGSVPTIIRSFKSATSKRIREELQRPAFRVWQRNYYESRVRDEREASNALRYIIENPTRWGADRDNPSAGGH